MGDGASPHGPSYRAHPRLYHRVVSLRCQRSYAIRGKADIARAVRACRSEAIDPNRLPHRSDCLVPYRDRARSPQYGSTSACDVLQSYLIRERIAEFDVLRGALKTADIRLGARCIAVERRDRGAVARLADGGEIAADIVVGADGIHSVVRQSLFGADAPRFTGCICWRGMATAAVPRDIAIAEGAIWMGPHGYVVHYPVRRGELINIVAHFDSDAWVEESWTRECDLSELTTTYAGWHSDLLRLYP
jgi:2-polyprenyl-6-methoxyphenol hydroxylase-like FAD-dependent oxidoreductase